MKTAKLVIYLLFASVLLAGTKHAERLNEAATVLEEVMAAPDKAIPQTLLDKAHCMIIIPGLKKGAFIFGAR